MNVTDPLLNPLIFFLSVIVKEFMITKFNRGNSNLVVNPKSRLVIWNSEQYQFLFSTFPAKIYGKIFQNKKKNYFGVIFVQRELFLQTLAMYNWRGPLAFKCQRYSVDWSSNQKLFHHYRHVKIVHLLCSIHQIIFFFFL